MPAQGQVVANMGAYVALIESAQQSLKNRLDLIAPETGGAAVRLGNLDMNSNSITEAKAITVDTLNWTTMNPSISGYKYRGIGAGVTLANSTTTKDLLPIVSTGTLVFAPNELSCGSIIKVIGSMVTGITATPTLTLRLTWNGTAIISHVLSVTASTTTFEATLLVTSTTNAMYNTKAIVCGPVPPLFSATSSATTAIDTTIENTLGFTGQWNAQSASNTATLNVFTVELVK